MTTTSVTATVAVEIAASTQQAGIDGRRTEVLWCNFEPADHLFAEGC